jgi:hypothetical protein
MSTAPDDEFIKNLKAKEAKMKAEISVKKQEIAIIEKQMASVKRTIEAFEGIKYGIEPKAKIPVPEVYSKHLPWAEKVLWAVKDIGGGVVDDITDALAKFDPNADKKSIKSMVTQYASQLKKSGNLQHQKLGIKHKYFI